MALNLIAFRQTRSATIRFIRADPRSKFEMANGPQTVHSTIATFTDSFLNHESSSTSLQGLSRSQGIDLRGSSPLQYL